MLRWLGALLVALFMVGSACADDEFLDPEQAFQFSARLKSNGTLEVHYLIAEGYYMYRDRFRFDVRPASIVLGAPRFPPGQWHEDEFFGVSQIFRGSVTIEIPILTAAESGTSIRLVAESQGCSEGGICYLPNEQTIDFVVLGELGAPAASQ